MSAISVALPGAIALTIHSANDLPLRYLQSSAHIIHLSDLEEISAQADRTMLPNR
ncbi:MAG: hypothetical protein HC780_28425 [Leptolyngbyaceae cyanobacterium CSU_1_3]|nr:hypothetical protein [Leptolyngbyaceae cyanobacterium CSU_1_3]